MDKIKTSRACPDCGIGNLYIMRRPLVRVVSGRVISVPGAVHRTCDVCNFAGFDPSAQQLLADMMVSLVPTTTTDTTESSEQLPKQQSAQS